MTGKTVVGTSRAGRGTQSACKRSRRRPAEPIRDSGPCPRNSPNVRVQSSPSRRHELRAWQTGASMYVRWSRGTGEGSTGGAVLRLAVTAGRQLPTDPAPDHPGVPDLDGGEAARIRPALAASGSIGCAAVSPSGEAGRGRSLQRGQAFAGGDERSTAGSRLRDAVQVVGREGQPDAGHAHGRAQRRWAATECDARARLTVLDEPGSRSHGARTPPSGAIECAAPARRDGLIIFLYGYPRVQDHGSGECQRPEEQPE